MFEEAGTLSPWRCFLVPPVRFCASCCFLPSCPASSPPSCPISALSLAQLLLSLGLASHLIPCCLPQSHLNWAPLFGVNSLKHQSRSQAHPRELTHYLKQLLICFLPGDWILVPHFPTSPWKLWHAVWSFFTCPYSDHALPLNGNIFPRTLEFARSSGNCTTALRAILTVVSPCHPINLFHLAQILLFPHCCWNVMLKSLSTSLGRAPERCRLSLCQGRPATVTRGYLSTPFLKGRVHFYICVHLDQKIRLHQSELSLSVCFAEKMRLLHLMVFYCFGFVFGFWHIQGTVSSPAGMKWSEQGPYRASHSNPGQEQQG